MDAISKKVNNWKGKNHIVFTNGCFDILHLGHIDYLFKASKLGDKLIVGVNTDKSIQRIKGENRPIQNESSRVSIMAALSCVDAVVLFHEDTPKQLIELIQPNTLVKGDDYKIEDIVGGDFVIANGGSVETIPFLKGYSTSHIISSIKNG
ncbi:MAG: D-glycero-beta-D-manno-heptose 1-phosphate adenylyltransferase [Bacteroidota bacterium]|nr:D-glycero-beta-D-manno-heptose 1-phosphate adenylyltransferase [Bacteroidota bacterium]